MRAALFTLVLLSGWLAALPSAAVAAAPADEWVEAQQAPQEAILVGRPASADPLRVGATPRFALPPSLTLTLTTVVRHRRHAKAAATAHPNASLARPIQPRAPPTTRR